MALVFSIYEEILYSCNDMAKMYYIPFSSHFYSVLIIFFQQSLGKDKSRLFAIIVFYNSTYNSLSFAQYSKKEPCAGVWIHLGIFKATTFLLGMPSLYNDGFPLHLHMELDPGNRRCSHLSVVAYYTDITERNTCVTYSGIHRILEIS